MKRKLIEGYPFVTYSRPKVTPADCLQKSEDFFQLLSERRTVREFSSKPLPIELIQNLIKTAGTAPSGAHKQPWTFCVVSDPHLKREIRIAAEEEERISYTSRMPDTWLKDLKPLGTDWQKPFLEDAPYLIIVFKQSYGMEGTKKIQHYYVNESVGIACGLLIAAIHQAGLVTVTHTPSPMNFLSEILNRPPHEKPFLVLPIGYPKDETFVPDIQRKKLEEIAVFFPNKTHKKREPGSL